MSIPPLHPQAPPKTESTPAPRGPECMDCGSKLGGKYCHICGQRKQRRVASVISLGGEFFRDIFNWDSRLWRTLWPLLAKPGYLTKTYMEGKRERHLPPVRLYLISSIVFFVIVSMSPINILGEVSDLINFKIDHSTPGLEQGLDSEITTESFKEVVAALNERGIINSSIETERSDEQNEKNEPDSTGGATVVAVVDGRDVLDVDREIGEDESATSSPQSSASPDLTSNEDQKPSVTVSDIISANEDGELSDEFDFDDVQVSANCEEVRNADFSSEIEFLRMPMYRFCLSVSTWRGLIAFLDELSENLPKTLLVLIPLMAFSNKLLYLFSGRYYVEHLLYYVHNYSFLFLFTLLLAGVGTLFGLVGVNVDGFLSFFGTLYVIYYFYKSMRVVYGQGHIFTFVKWVLLMLTFFCLVGVVLAFFTLATAALHGL